MSLDDYDIKVIREEGEDIRRELKTLQADIRTTNNILNAVLHELVKMNEKPDPSFYSRGSCHLGAGR